MDMSQYRDLFVSEAREHIRSMNEYIVALEKDRQDRENIDSLFRMAHSVKGMAASMGYQAIADLAHKMEDFMDRVRKGTLAFEGGCADLLLEGADTLDGMVEDIERQGETARDTAALIERLVNYVPEAATPVVAEEAPPVASEEHAPKPPPNVPDSSPQSPAPEVSRNRADYQTVRVRTEVLDHLINVTGELVTTKYRLLNIASPLDSLPLNGAITELSRLLRELQNEVMTARMLPFSTLVDRFPRPVRDLARRQGKEIAFEIEGREMELDRGILEGLADPLLHMLRNSVDHGIEPAAIRKRAGKSAVGTIRLSAIREKDQFLILLEDDGRGMDPAHLISLAVERGIVTPEEGWSMSAEQAFLLTCHPGFSTAQQVTDVSGRGVGMDAVRSAIQALGGQLLIESILGKGTRMILRLPLTIAIINVLLAECAGMTVAIPVNKVIRTVEPDRTTLCEEDGRLLFPLDDEKVPLLDLREVVRSGPRTPYSSIVPILVTTVGERKVGLAVDRFLGHQEVFVKPLGRPLSRLLGLSGGAMLGDGTMVFVIDVAGIAQRSGF